MSDTVEVGAGGDDAVRPFEWRRPGDPPRWVFLSCLAALSLWSVWLNSGFGGDLTAGVLTVGSWLALGLAWLGLLLTAVFRREGRVRLRSAWVRWLVVPAVVLALGAALATGLPTRTRMALSEDALRDVAVAVVEGRSPGLGWVGLYHVEKAEAVRGGALLTLSGDPGLFALAHGLAYLPDGPDTVDRKGREMYFEHVQGPWYYWYDRW